MQKILVATILIFISIGSFIICSRSFREKGFLINNAYIYASKPERERMDKKPHYHQTAIVFLLLGIIFLLNGLRSASEYRKDLLCCNHFIHSYNYLCYYIKYNDSEAKHEIIESLEF